MRVLSTILLIASLLAGCNESNQTTKDESDSAVTIVTKLMEFEMPDSIPSGWTTFKYINKSKEPHFFLFDKMPEGKTVEDSKEYIVPLFQEGMDSINKGNPEAAYAAFGKLPEWFSEIEFVGGSGLISPGDTSKTTLFMEPGYYVVECYVKMKGGVFHTSQGMIKGLVVTEEKSGNTEPEPTAEVTIAYEDGITFQDTLEAGKHIIKVNFKDQKAHENFVGHDVHIVRLLGSAPEVRESLNAWMDWSSPTGLINPAPDSIEFMGGSQEMPGGGVAYIEVDLKPGNYALISEVPDPQSKGMFPVFVVE